jgi:hypothetical protein
VGNLARRLKKLETGGPRRRRCPECGFDGDLSKVVPKVVWVTEPRETEEDDRPRESVYCETCGEAVHVVVTWGDDV